MKIVMISDTHGHHDKLTIPECDLLIHAGDMSRIGTSGQVGAFLSWFAEQPAAHKVAIPGNHDFTCTGGKLWYDTFADAGCHLLFGDGVEIEGLKVWGSPWTPWFNDWAFNFAEGDRCCVQGMRSRAEKHWSQIPNDTDVLITHGPPHGILDAVARGGENVGCKRLMERVARLNDLKLHVFGHIHEARGTLKVGSTTFVNASTLDLGYRVVRSPIEMEVP